MEYWVFIIINVIIGNFLASIDMAQGTYISFIFFLAIFLPTIALTFRRLHDTGRKGWLALPLFIAAQWLGFFLEAIRSAARIQTSPLTDFLEFLPAWFTIPSVVIGFISALFLFYFGVLDGVKGENKYGPNPKEEEEKTEKE